MWFLKIKEEEKDDDEEKKKSETNFKIKTQKDKKERFNKYAQHMRIIISRINLFRQQTK